MIREKYPFIINADEHLLLQITMKAGKKFSYNTKGGDKDV
jgi:hypothetical protein